MKKIAKRLAAKVCKYLALTNVTISAGDRNEIERMIYDELKESQKRDSMHGREEMEAEGNPS